MANRNPQPQYRPHTNGGSAHLRNGTAGNHSNGYIKSSSSSSSHQQPHHQPAPPPINGSTTAAVDDEFQDETLYFERNRIQQLKDERVHIQKKTFTKWCNSYLNKARLEVNDLFTDLSDGILLIKFLEIISGEKLGKPNHGRMRVQKIENLNRCFEFLKHKRIQLENIGAEDILDGNERLILGLIWTIILRFSIENIEIESQESGEMKRAKEALLLWCQRKTLGYPNVKIDNFSTSWRNGLAFSALIHAHRPELINFDALNPQDALGNLNHAFDVADRKLDIPRLLDAEDVNVAHPDEKSVITYVSLFYHYFAKQKTELTGARRVAKVVGELLQQDHIQEDYEQVASDLLVWIERTIEWLRNRNFPNGLKEMQDELLAFNQYRKVDKPPKYKEKGELEALFFAIQTKRGAAQRRAYAPPEGLFLHDVETAWGQLDKAENERQLALIAELQRQEKLELKAHIFYRKAAVRDTWLREIIQVLKNFELQASVSKVEAASKMLQNVSTEAGPKTDRFKMLSQMSAELQRENFHGAEAVRLKEREIIDRWNSFLALLRQKEKNLAGLKELTSLIRDMETLVAELKHLEPSLRSRDTGKHILAVEDLLQKHELVEASVNANGEWLQNIKRQALDYIHGKGSQHEVLGSRLEELTHQFDGLLVLCKERRALLNRTKEYFQFLQNFEEEMSWLAEKDSFCQRMLEARDVANAPHTTLQYKALESEMQAHWQRSKGIINGGERLQPITSHTKEEVHSRIQALQVKWETLRHVTAALAKWLTEAEKARQYFQDANDAESWIREKMPLASSEDYGRDLGAAEALHSRHLRLEEEIHTYRADILRLDEVAAQLAGSEFGSDMTVETNGGPIAQRDAGAVEEIPVPKVRALYSYQAQGKGTGIGVEQGEILALLDKSHSDWWRVLKQDGAEGYVPANYCQLVKGETITVNMPGPTKASSSAPGRKASSTSAKSSPILERQEGISSNYRRLNSLAQERRRLLNDAIKLFKFLNECEDFALWTKEASTSLQEITPMDHVQAHREKFKKQEADVQTNGGVQLRRINEMAEELVAESHTQTPVIRTRQQTANKLWDELQRIMQAKWAGLESALILASFKDECANTKGWMAEKFELLRRQPDSGEVKALQALQRRYQNLERDLKPLDERLVGLRQKAGEIAKKYPEHRDEVDRAIAELAAMHADLIRQARQRINEAEHQQGQQMFDSAADELLTWLERTRKGIASEAVVAPSLASAVPAEELIKRHMDVRDEINAKGYEFDYVNELGERLLSKPQNGTQPSRSVKGRLGELAQARKALEEEWEQRDNEFKQLLELQLFTREADRIDALSKGHVAFLAVDSTSHTVEGVENAQKQYADFESKFAAQEERVRLFDATAQSLLKAGHSHADYIGERRAQVRSNRERVLELGAERKAKLEQTLTFEKLRRAADELATWMEQKKRTAKEGDLTTADSSGGSGTTLDKMLLKHEAFVAELQSNAVQLERIRHEGTALVAQRHFAEPRISALIQDLSQEWQELTELVEKKSRRLVQVDGERALLSAIRDVHAKISELEHQLASEEQGADLPSVKELIRRRDSMEQEIALLQERITEISQHVKHMTDEGHYDAKGLAKQVDELLAHFNVLQAPLERRRKQLEESLKWHQLAFDADVELQWVAEKRPVVDCRADLPNSLTEAANLLKRHDQLDAEVGTHRPKVEAIVAQGKELVKEGHFSAAQIGTKMDQLSQAWDALMAAVAVRCSILKWGLAKQQYLSNLDELEAWAADKNQFLSASSASSSPAAPDQWKRWDETKAATHAASIKSLLVDTEAHRKRLAELRAQCESLTGECPKGCEDDQAQLASKQEKVEMEFTFLEELAARRVKEVEAFISLCAYDAERVELEEWVNAKQQTASSNDYGADHDQLLELEARHDGLRKEVAGAGTERYNRCEQLANSVLIAASSAPSIAKQVVQNQEHVHAVWTRLLTHLEQRGSGLKRAGALHAFNRDVQEPRERLQEKVAALPQELGRDVKHAGQLIAKHEIFENETGQLRIQLDQLASTGMELQSELEKEDPRGCENIARQLGELEALWKGLATGIAVRRTKLLASQELQKFLARTRDFLAWTSQLVASMQVDQKVRDLQSAEWLHQEHQHLRAEIEARRDEFSAVQQMGNSLIQKKHFASDEVGARLSQISTAYDGLMREWALKNEWVEQQIDWHGFEREVHQTLAAIASKQMALDSFAEPAHGGVQEAETQLRKLETYQRGLAPVEERASAIDSLAKQLVEKRHSESANIDNLDQKVLASLSALGAKVEEIKKGLGKALDLAKFDSEIGEMSEWIDERANQLRVPSSGIQQQQADLTLEQKLEQLRKHQALEGEVAANATRIAELQKQLAALRGQSPSSGDKQKSKLARPLKEIFDRADSMLAKWRDLNASVQQLGAAAKEAKDIFEFNQAVEKVMAWIHDKELMLSAEEMGNDREHAQLLLDKLLGRGDSVVECDAAAIQHVNNLGEQLIAGGSGHGSSRDEIQKQLREMNEAYAVLQGRMEEYKALLVTALEVHQFNSDVDETNGRILEKTSLLSSEDYGRDLAAVEQLLRKQDEIERDMSAIHLKLNDHDNEAKRLLGGGPPLRDSIIESLQKLERSWQALAQLAHSRRLRLQQSFQLQKYFDSVKRLEQWANALRTKMTAYARPRTADDVQALMKAHQDRLAEMESRSGELKSLRELGQKIGGEQPDHRAEIQRAHRRLQNIEHQIRQTWEQEHTTLQRELWLKALQAQLVQVESWLATKEAVVNQQELGDSVDAVNQLIRDHEAFVQTLQSQSDKVEQLKQVATTLSEHAGDHSPEMEKTREQYGEALRRHEALLERCTARRNQLEESRKLHDFLRKAGDVITWMNTRLQLVYDDAIIDPTNLRSKLQKHLAFDAELQASGDRVGAVREEGEKLITEGHYDRDTIEAQLAELTSGWSELKTKSANKAQLLRNSYDNYLLTRKLDEMDAWLSQFEHQLSTNDHGGDVQSVEALIEQHKGLVAEIGTKQPVMEELVKKTKALSATDETHKAHPDLEALHMRAEALSQRLNGLHEPCQIRQENLLESLRHFQWASEVDEQLLWIHDKIPQLESRDYGTTLHAAQSLTKRHAIVEQEVESRQPTAQLLVTKGQELGAAVSGKEVKAKVEQLIGGMEMLKSLAAERSLRLKQSLQSQEYYAEEQEAEQWMRERLPLAANQDIGAGQTTAETHFHRLTALEQEVGKFGEHVQKLNNACRGMMVSGHFDSAQLTVRQAKLEKLYDELKKECARRRNQLADAIRYYSFQRQADELIAWLREKRGLAEKEEYGADLDDCCQLVEQFQQVVRELSGAGERVAGVMKLHEELLSSGHPNAGSIRAKGSDLQRLWNEVNDASNERQQALTDGKNIHLFDQRADEMLARLAEKEAHLVALESEDLSSVDATLMNGYAQRHEDFLHSLYVVEKQVGELCREADKIIQQFPRTEEHLEVRRSELAEQLKDVQEGARRFSLRLTQAQANKTYFKEHRDLMAWIRHMQTVITGEILPRSLNACRELETRHGEYRAEIRSREQQKQLFVERGHAMIQQGNVLSNEIKVKVEDLETGFQQLYDTWHRRQRVYEENMDLRQWLQQAESLESWLAEREQFLAEDWHTAESVEGVEELLRRFDDFLVTLEAQSPHFEALKRLTKLEESYARMRQREKEMFGDAGHAVMNGDRRRSEIQQPGRRDTQQIRVMEKKKILQEKRQERERRKTQEVSVLPRHAIVEEAFIVDPRTLPRARRVASTANATSQQDAEGQHKLLHVPGPATTSAPSSRQTSEGQSIPLEFDSSGGTDKSYPLRRVPSGRTPGFTTRRPQSIKKMRAWDDLKSIDMHGYLDRKQELQGGGKRATFRSWKNYYTILCGQLLCFFKDEEAFMENVAAAPPVFLGVEQGKGPHSTLPAKCSIYPDYVKRKYTFKLNTADGAEFLFSCENNLKMIEWVEKINFHARLEPKDQLATFRPLSMEGIPLSSPPPLQPNELMRSRTLELHLSLGHGARSDSAYMTEEDGGKSTTLTDLERPQRPLSLEGDGIFQQRLEVSTTISTASATLPHSKASHHPAQSTPGSSVLGSPPQLRNGEEEGKFGASWAGSISSGSQHLGEAHRIEMETDSLRKKRSGLGSLFKRSSKNQPKLSS